MIATNNTPATVLTNAEILARINILQARLSGNITPRYAKSLNTQIANLHARLTPETVTPADVNEATAAAAVMTPPAVMTTQYVAVSEARPEARPEASRAVLNGTPIPTCAPVGTLYDHTNDAAADVAAVSNDTATAARGRVASMLDREYTSYVGMCRAIALDVATNGKNSTYFRKIAIAHAAAFVVAPPRQEGESETKYAKRVERHALHVAAERYHNTPDDKIKNTILYRVLSSKNKLYGFMRLNVARYIAEGEENGRAYSRTVLAQPHVLIKCTHHEW